MMVMIIHRTRAFKKMHSSTAPPVRNIQISPTVPIEKDCQHNVGLFSYIITFYH